MSKPAHKLDDNKSKYVYLRRNISSAISVLILCKRKASVKYVPVIHLNNFSLSSGKENTACESKLFLAIRNSMTGSENNKLLDMKTQDGNLNFRRTTELSSFAFRHKVQKTFRISMFLHPHSELCLTDRKHKLASSQKAQFIISFHHIHFMCRFCCSTRI